MDKQITISVDEYNKLIDEHTKREELPEKIDVKKISSKWFNWLKRVSYSLLHYNKNIEQQKLVKRCIEELQVRYELISMDIGEVICRITLRMVILTTH